MQTHNLHTMTGKKSGCFIIPFKQLVASAVAQEAELVVY